MITKIEGNCQIIGCDKKATAIACGRNGEAKLVCEEHKRVLSEEESPEYILGCPNCGCVFPCN